MVDVVVEVVDVVPMVVKMVATRRTSSVGIGSTPEIASACVSPSPTSTFTIRTATRLDPTSEQIAFQSTLLSRRLTQGDPFPFPSSAKFSTTTAKQSQPTIYTIFIVEQTVVGIDAVISAVMLSPIRNEHTQRAIEPIVRKHDVIHKNGST